MKVSRQRGVLGGAAVARAMRGAGTAARPNAPNRCAHALPGKAIKERHHNRSLAVSFTNLSSRQA
jgi:hypothetical protein